MQLKLRSNGQLFTFFPEQKGSGSLWEEGSNFRSHALFPNTEALKLIAPNSYKHLKNLLNLRPLKLIAPNSYKHLKNLLNLRPPRIFSSFLQP